MGGGVMWWLGAHCRTTRRSRAWPCRRVVVFWSRVRGPGCSMCGRRRELVVKARLAWRAGTAAGREACGDGGRDGVTRGRPMRLRRLRAPTPLTHTAHPHRSPTPLTHTAYPHRSPTPLSPARPCSSQLVLTHASSPLTYASSRLIPTHSRSPDAGERCEPAHAGAGGSRARGRCRDGWVSLSYVPSYLEVA